MRYCESVYKTRRWRTREVLVGSVGVGGTNPIRIQSMTTSSTRDVKATVDQIMRLADAGCEIARVTVQGLKEAEACEAIKADLIRYGYGIPLVADIHFFPPAAMQVVDFVDKVRINPGNFVDKRASFKKIVYDDVSYALEVERIEEKFMPLVEKCKRLKRAMRIGTNHGSLSDRIMNRYGDTPQGMVESALEFARICRAYDYHDLIFSMKASNPQVMILAYRLLVAEMMALGWDYPLHLGVTEAGAGEDGRIKSAMGIGSLLLDGLGDTIRVSLTEDAWHEIDPCKRLIAFARSYEGTGVDPFEEQHRFIASMQRRTPSYTAGLSLHRDGTVIASVTSGSLPKSDCLVLQRVVAPDFLDAMKEEGMTLFSLGTNQKGTVPILSLQEALLQKNQHLQALRFSLTTPPTHPVAVIIHDESKEEWAPLLTIKPDLIFLSPSLHRLHYARMFFDWVAKEGLSIPVILAFSYEGSQEDLVIHAAAEMGSLLCDGLGDGIWIRSSHEPEWITSLSFSLLQSARMRMSKTDFISCPSCGRTLFDLQEVSQRIREKTAHLPGVKIAIMGCIVNGPGEMADADFGYVGSKPGMIDLYVGKTCVERNIPSNDADDRLIALIKQHGRWVDREVCV